MYSHVHASTHMYFYWCDPLSTSLCLCTCASTFASVYLFVRACTPACLPVVYTHCRRAYVCGAAEHQHTALKQCCSKQALNACSCFKPILFVLVGSCSGLLAMPIRIGFTCTNSGPGNHYLKRFGQGLSYSGGLYNGPQGRATLKFCDFVGNSLQGQALEFTI